MECVAIRPVVLSGGSGTRLWPLSTSARPKQFLSLLGAESLLKQTIRRFETSHVDRLTFSSPLIIGNAGHADLINNAAPGVSVLLEPFGRNSAPAVAAATLLAAEDEFILILPSDHAIQNIEAFHEAVGKGIAAATNGAIVSFGVVAAYPETGYGYIEAVPGADADAFNVHRFVEKPDKATAQSYIDAGNFFWNAGIFLFRADVMRDAFEKQAPDILAAVKKALPAGAAMASGRMTLDSVAFAACPSNSVDYAIMENHPLLSVVPVDMGWSDIGDFRALWELSEKDENGNVLVGNVAAIDCSDCYIYSEAGSISVVGQSRRVMVATETDVMSCDLENAQQVKALAERCK